jgi:sugar lactone lactonase YvrE
MVDPAGKGIYYVTGKQSGSLIQYSVGKQSNMELDQGVISQPIISPDGKRVMYASFNDQANDELWVSDLDGTHKSRVFATPRLGTGDWSADGKWVGFESTGTNEKSYVASIDGQNVVQLPDVHASVLNVVWNPDGKTVYMGTTDGTIWQAKTDGSHAEKIARGFVPFDVSRDGKYLVGMVWIGQNVGMYQLSLSDKKITNMLPNVVSFSLRIAPDQKSLLYALSGEGEITIYRVPWIDGKVTGEPQVALKLPFAFSQNYRGNAYDFSRDLSTIVYAKPSAQMDLYLLHY